jgi:hypothetical protein
MQSPAPQKQKIAGRSDSSGETKEAFNIIENIEAVTEEDKKEAESDPSVSTITEREIEDKDPPETDGGSIKKAVEALEVFAIPSTSASGVDGTSESSSSSSTSTSSSSSSTVGSDKSDDISSLDSSDSSSSYSDLESDSSATDKK